MLAFQPQLAFEAAFVEIRVDPFGLLVAKVPFPRVTESKEVKLKRLGDI